MVQMLIGALIEVLKAMFGVVGAAIEGAAGVAGATFRVGITVLNVACWPILGVISLFSEKVRADIRVAMSSPIVEDHGEFAVVQYQGGNA